MKFRKKPVVIEAYQYVDGFWDNEKIPDEFINAICLEDHCGCYGGHIHTMEGAMEIADDDWIIKGIMGEFYPCKPDIFEATYEPVE